MEENFTGRKDEINHLVQNFKSLKNTIIISPRGWGKSSLIENASTICFKSEKDLKFCFIDLNSIRSEEEFVTEIAKQLLKTISWRSENIVDVAKKFLWKLYPKIKMNDGSQNDISLSFDLEEIRQYPEEVFNLAEKIAIDMGIKIIVCISEFQNLSNFSDVLAFQQKMKLSWSNHKNVAYCLYGSNRDVLSNMFIKPEMPFYGFGDILLLEKISSTEWVPFVLERFVNTGKSIDEKCAEYIVRIADNHSQYVQILAKQSWIRSPFICDDQIIDNALDSILLLKSMLFHNITDKLSNTQISFLKAMICGIEKFNSQKVLIKYKLGTSGNISKIKKALSDKKIIDIQHGKISFQDPFYKSWLKKFYFKIM